MRRRRRPLVALDQADLVLVAAHVLDQDPADVVAAADVAVLSGLASRLAGEQDLANAAAETLVAVAAGRPFGIDDDAIAWLAAAVLVDRNGHSLDEDDDGWVALVRAAAAGTIAERDVADALAPALHPTPGPLRRMIAAACRPRECTVPSRYPCPACGADVARDALWLFPVAAVPTEPELVAACVRRRGDHDRMGNPTPPAPTAPQPHVPVVLGDGEGPVAFVALTDHGPVAFVRDERDAVYDVVALDELTPSDLVGSWSSSADHGRHVGRVPTSTCPIDDDDRIDWSAVAAALTTERTKTEEMVPA